MRVRQSKDLSDDTGRRTPRIDRDGVDGRYLHELDRRRPRSRYKWLAWFAVVLALLGGGMIYAYDIGWLNFAFVARGPGPVSEGLSAEVIFSGNAKELIVAPGTVAQQDSTDPSLTWIRSSLTAAQAGGTVQGASVAIDKKLTNAWLGKLVRVIVSATAGSQNSPPPFAVAYSSNGSGNSGWIVFNPTAEFADYSFDFRVPSGTVSTPHYVGIWSDITGRNSALGVRRITVRVLQ